MKLLKLTRMVYDVNTKIEWEFYWQLIANTDARLREAVL